MSRDWLSHPIMSRDKSLCDPIGPNVPLLPIRGQITFRAVLLYNAWQAYAADGRFMTSDDHESMNEFVEEFSDGSHTESTLESLVQRFGEFLPAVLFEQTADVPERALIRTQDECARLDTRSWNTPMPDTDPLSKTSEDYADLIAKLGSPDSPVGIDAKYTHAVIIEYLRQITARLERIEARLDAKS